MTKELKDKTFILAEGVETTLDTRISGLNNNICVIGAAGTGKSRYNVKPNLMQMNGSYIVNDPKGALLKEMGTMFETNGYKIRVLNLNNPSQSNYYNPFSYISKTTPELDIRKLAHTIVYGQNLGKKVQDPFWDQSAELLISSLIAMVYFYFPEKEKVIPTILTMLNAMEVREEDDYFKNAVDLMFNDLEKEEPDCYALNLYKAYKLAAGKTAKSILITAMAYLNTIFVKDIKLMMSGKDEFELRKLGEEKTVIFVTISDTDDTLYFLADMFFKQVFDILAQEADKLPSGSLELPVQVIMDDFGSAMTVPNFDSIISTCRARNIGVTIIMQSEGQLRARYGKDEADTIIANCMSYVYLGGQEATQSQIIAEKLGIPTKDVSNLPRGYCYVFQPGNDPKLCKLYDLKKHPNYMQTSEGSSSEVFNVENYLYEMRHTKLVDYSDYMFRN